MVTVSETAVVEPTSAPPEGRPRGDARAARSVRRAVALPAEHGGWGLTLEPALLGLLVAPSVAGTALALAAFVAFLARTPLKVVLVDHRRHQTRDRTRIATRIAAIEATLLIAFLAVATTTADLSFIWAGLLAAPLMCVELWFDVRSRSRRLTPELAGAFGIAVTAAAIVLADGADWRLAFGIWLLLSARALTAIPHVRTQVARLHDRVGQSKVIAVADGLSVVAAGIAVAFDRVLVPGAIAVLGVIVAQRLSARRLPRSAKALGMRQMAYGLTIVAVTAVGVLAS
jgi:hypothetical protein